jgi:SAM-dependent methyltransferase
MRVLDCGCGTGMAAVLWARSGARVWGFDISPQRVSLAKKRAVVNGVANQVSLQVGAFEELCYQAESFDLLFGIHVLHHVDVAKAAREAHRVLKPGGKAVFWEPMDRNPVLRFFRRYAGRFGIVKLGSQHEHPLTSRDLEDLSAAFGGRARVHNTGFYFFSLLDRNVVRYRSRALSRLLRGLDLGAARLLPPLRRYSFVGLVELTK